MAQLFDNASTIINLLWPIAAIGIGFALGGRILRMLQSSIGGGVK